MAYVDRGGSRDDGRDAAQIIVLAGFILALGIIVVTTSLNLVIFSQDLSSRDVTPFERQVDDIRNTVNEGSESAVVETNDQNLNELNGPGSATEDLYENYADDFTSSLENITINNGEFANVSMSVDDTAWRTMQASDEEFMNEAGDSDWYMTDSSRDVGEVFRVSFNISDTESSPFRILAVNDETNFAAFGFAEGWRMTIDEDEINICDGTIRDSGSRVCFGASETIDTDWDGDGSIQVVNDSVDGTAQNLLNDWVDDSEDYYLRFEQADNAEGTYEIWFNEGGTPTDDLCSSGGPPCTGTGTNITGAVLNTTTEYQYVTSEVNHTGDVEVTAP